MVTRTDGPFEYWEVTGDAVRSVAESPGSNAAVIESLAGELEGDEQQAAAAIEGDITEGVKANTTAAKNAAQSLAAKGQYAVGLLRQFATDVDAFDTTVNQINLDYQTQYSSTIYGMQHQPEYRDGTETIDHAAVAASVKSNLMSRYKAAEGVIDDAADAIATKFKQGPTDENVRDLIRAGLIPLASAGLFPTLVLTDDDKRQALKSTIAAMTPAEQAAYVKSHPEFEDAWVEVLSPEAQEILANDVAADIVNDKVDEETVRILALLSAAPAFAAQLFDQVEPADLAKAIKTLEEDAFPQPGYDQSQEKIDLYKDFLTNAGSAFATYTKGEGEYAPPADLAKTWFNAITGDDGYDGNAAALTLMVRAGGHETSYDTDFLADLTGDLYDWERGQDGAVWGPRDYDGIVDPFSTKIDEGRHFATDGLANMLGAMENSPGAAQKFFHEGYPDGDTSKENDRLHYLLTERTFSDSAYSDEGDGLGAALEAAATGHREHTLIPGTSEYGDDWSASFTSEVFNTIADKSGTGDDLPGSLDDVWHIWPDMADNLGAIGASYSSDIYDIVGRAPVPGGPHLQIDLADLDKVFGEIGRGDKSGIETLSAGIMLEGNSRLQDAIDQWQQAHPGESIDLESVTEGALGEALRGTGGTSGEILGHIVNKAITVDEHDQSLAETRAAYVSKAIDIAGGFIPGAGSVLGEGASELLKSGYDVAKGEGLNLLKNAVEGAGSATGGDYERSERSSLSQSLENNITSQLIQSGIITVGDGPGQIPASLVTDGPDGTQVLNPDLYDADGPDKIGEDGQYTQAEKDKMLTDLNRWFGDIDSRYVESITQPAQDGLDRELNK